MVGSWGSALLFGAQLTWLQVSGLRFEHVGWLQDGTVSANTWRLHLLIKVGTSLFLSFWN